MSQQVEEELLALPYRELQARAKEAGLKASGCVAALRQGGCVSWQADACSAPLPPNSWASGQATLACLHSLNVG